MRGSAGARWLARLYSLVGTYCGQQFRRQQARDAAEKAEALLDAGTPKQELAFVLLASSSASFWVGNKAEGRASAERSLELYRASDDRWGTARALLLLGRDYMDWADLGRAEACFRESIEVQRAFGDGSIVLPRSLMGLGEVLAERGNYADGCQLMQEALEHIERQGDLSSTVKCLHCLANAHRKRGDYPAAEKYARRGLTLASEAFPFADHCQIVTLGDVLKEQGQLDEALAMYQTCLGTDNEIRTAMGNLNIGDVAMLKGHYQEAEQTLRAALKSFEHLKTVWGIVLVCDNLGHLACLRGDYAGAQSHLVRALRLALEMRSLPFALSAMSAAALLLCRRDNLALAAELVGFVQSQRATELQTLNRRIKPLSLELAAKLPRAELTARLQRGQETVDFEYALGQAVDALHQLTVEAPESRHFPEQ